MMLWVLAVIFTFVDVYEYCGNFMFGDNFIKYGRLC